MIRTVNEEPCHNCRTLTNAYDQLRGRLCPNCAGVSEPLINHLGDIEVTSSSYHISNAIWEQWLENARQTFAEKHISKASKEKFLLGLRDLLYKVAVASAKVFASNEEQPTFILPNRGSRKNCSRYAECLSRLDWQSNHHRSCFSLVSCPYKCEFYVESYSIWAFEEKTIH